MSQWEAETERQTDRDIDRDRETETETETVTETEWGVCKWVKGTYERESVRLHPDIHMWIYLCVCTRAHVCVIERESEREREREIVWWLDWKECRKLMCVCVRVCVCVFSQMSQFHLKALKNNKGLPNDTVTISPTRFPCPVGWGSRIHWLHLCWGVRPPIRVS